MSLNAARGRRASRAALPGTGATVSTRRSRPPYGRAALIGIEAPAPRSSSPRRAPRRAPRAERTTSGESSPSAAQDLAARDARALRVRAARARSWKHAALGFGLWLVSRTRRAPGPRVGSEQIERLVRGREQALVRPRAAVGARHLFETERPAATSAMPASGIAVEPTWASATIAREPRTTARGSSAEARSAEACVWRASCTTAYVPARWSRFALLSSGVFRKTSTLVPALPGRAPSAGAPEDRILRQGLRCARGSPPHLVPSLFRTARARPGAEENGLGEAAREQRHGLLGSGGADTGHGLERRRPNGRTRPRGRAGGARAARQVGQCGASASAASSRRPRRAWRWRRPGPRPRPRRSRRWLLDRRVPGSTFSPGPSAATSADSTRGAGAAAHGDAHGLSEHRQFVSPQRAQDEIHRRVRA